MLSGEFNRKLKKLNRKLRIWCSDDDTKPAGLFYVSNGEYVPVCSVDKSIVPRHTIATAKNKIIKAGWQRTLRVLIQMRLIDKKQAIEEFGPMDRKRVTIYEPNETNDRIEDLTNSKYYHGTVDHNGQPIFTRNEILDMKEELSRRK